MTHVAVETPSGVDQAQVDLLDQAFEGLYGGRPSHAVWSPGRVNLIGEHTDYNFLPVLPMAIGRGFTLRLRPSAEPRIRIRTLDSLYPPVEFDITADIPRSPAGHWGNYVKAAVNKMAPLIAKERGACVGFDAVITSSLPPAAGMSSSSALVVASYLALAAANDWKLDKMAAAEITRQAELYVGTASGGMDQAVICLGQKNRALKIDFEPLRVREVALPGEVTFFAIDSMERAAKSGNVRFQYNRRVVECYAGMMLMARWVGEVGEKWTSLRDAYEYLSHNGTTFSEAALAAIGTETYSFERLQTELGSRLDDLLARKQQPPASDPLWKTFPGFQLYGRVMHVFEETDRLYRCVRALENGECSEAAHEINESHYSCRDLYNISTPGLERLVSTALKSGALAARITGAGFGGSIIAMVEKPHAEEFAARVWEEFYAPRASQLGLSNGSDVIIRCEPSEGATAWAL